MCSLSKLPLIVFIFLQQSCAGTSAETSAPPSTIEESVPQSPGMKGHKGEKYPAATGQQQGVEGQRELLSVRLAYQSRVHLADYPDRALLLSVEATRAFPTFEAKESLLAALLRYPNLAGFLHGNIGLVKKVIFSPDGKTLASVSEDGGLLLWDVATRRALGPSLTRDGEKLTSLAFSPDSKTLVTGDTDSHIVLWDVANRQPLGPPLIGNAQGVASLAFSPNGKILASGGGFSESGGPSNMGTVILWDLTTRKTLGPPFTDLGNVVRSLAFSPDGNTLAVGCEDFSAKAMFEHPRKLGSLILLDWATRGSIELAFDRQVERNGPITDVAFSADGKTLASVFKRDFHKPVGIALWNLTTYEPIPLELENQPNPLTGAVFSSDGRMLVSATEDGHLSFWEVETGHALGSILSPEAKPVSTMAFSQDGTMLASGSKGGRLVLWALDTRSAISFPTNLSLVGKPGLFASVAFSPDGKVVASGTESGKLILWDVATREPLGPPLIKHTKEITSVAISPDGRLLASSGLDGRVIIWDVATRQPIGKPLVGHSHSSSLAFSPDGKTFVSGGTDGRLIHGDTITHEALGLFLGDDDKQVWSVSFSPGGKLVASGMQDGSILLWDVVAHRIVAPPFIGHTNRVTSVAFSPDGKFLASGGEDAHIILWDMATLKPLVPPLSGHGGEIDTVAFSPDGKMVASSGTGRIVFWDVATRQPIGTVVNPTQHYLVIAFSPDGKMLVSGGVNNLVLWDVSLESWQAHACLIANRNLTLEEWWPVAKDLEPPTATCSNVPKD